MASRVNVLNKHLVVNNDGPPAGAPDSHSHSHSHSNTASSQADPEKDWRLLPGETEKERGERLLQGMIEIGQRGSGQVGEAK